MTGRRPVVTVYTRQRCGLCAKAERLARREARRALVELVDIDRDDELQRRYNIRVPVVEVDGVEVAELVVEPGTIRTAVKQARRGAGRWSGGPGRRD